MEKPGQGPPHPEVFVQDEVKSPLRRIVEDFITVVCWGIYLYLLLPLFTLVLWVFGVQTIYDQIIGQKGYEELSRLLANGGITVLVIFLIVSGWTYYNYLWFLRRGEGVEAGPDRSDGDGGPSHGHHAMERYRQRLEIRVDGPNRITARD
jgi:poly-beta-1,6-N-acetyl-D-glucosamine biosynthesis protein PgaD